jgi:hypothetical protein
MTVCEEVTVIVDSDSGAASGAYLECSSIDREATHRVTWRDEAGVGEMLMCDRHTEEFKEADSLLTQWSMIEVLHA